MQTPNPHESQILLPKTANAIPLPNIPTNKHATNMHGQSNNAGALQMPPTKQSYNQAHATKKGIKGRREMPRIIFGVISVRDTDLRGKLARECMEDLRLVKVMWCLWRQLAAPANLTPWINFLHQLSAPSPSFSTISRKKRDGSVENKTEAGRRSTFKFLINSWIYLSGEFW